MNSLHFKTLLVFCKHCWTMLHWHSIRNELHIFFIKTGLNKYLRFVYYSTIRLQWPTCFVIFSYNENSKRTSRGTRPFWNGMLCLCLMLGLRHYWRIVKNVHFIFICLYHYKPIPCSKNRSPMQSLCLQKLNWLKSNWLNLPTQRKWHIPTQKHPLFYWSFVSMSTHKLEFSLQFVPLASILIISLKAKLPVL